MPALIEVNALRKRFGGIEALAGVRLNGIDVVQRPVDARRVLGVVSQEVALYSDLSARDNLAFFGKL